MVAKRLMDLFVASIISLVFAPVWLILPILIRLESTGPALFVQDRSGKYGKPFKMYKFRSMVINDVDPLQLGPLKYDHPLITSVGRFMRRMKLDELPQLLNVFRGEMSMVGPRPCLVSQVESIFAQAPMRFDVPPGMTGWAEVNGNVELTPDEQLVLDTWYVKNYSICLDILVLFKTIGVVVFGSKRNEAVIGQAQEFYDLFMSRKGKQV
jgi:lipopolysaccharide/colanic/teichoic acid biosynthesis glycosyltransferase